MGIIPSYNLADIVIPLMILSFGVCLLALTGLLILLTDLKDGCGPWHRDSIGNSSQIMIVWSIIGLFFYYLKNHLILADQRHLTIQQVFDEISIWKVLILIFILLLLSILKVLQLFPYIGCILARDQGKYFNNCTYIAQSKYFTYYL